MCSYLGDTRDLFTQGPGSPGFPTPPGVPGWPCQGGREMMSQLTKAPYPLFFSLNPGRGDQKPCQARNAESQASWLSGACDVWREQDYHLRLFQERGEDADLLLTIDPLGPGAPGGPITPRSPCDGDSKAHRSWLGLGDSRGRDPKGGKNVTTVLGVIP